MAPKRMRQLLDRYRVTDGAKFRLKDHDPDDTAPDLIDPEEGPALLPAGVERLAELQELLYAEHTWSLLCVLQAMDAGGKDGTIKHVMTGVNPQGVSVSPFKAPGPEELDHGFLWRVIRELPARGRIGIFNRSHYEEVLVVRVHPEVLERQNLPMQVRGKKFWQHRLEDIANFERYLTRQGTVVAKFFLNISRDEQKRRLLARLDQPKKTWKFSAADVEERRYWNDYQSAYEEAIAATATEHAPWYVVPANAKWFARLVVVEALVATLEDLDLAAPKVSPEQHAHLAEVRRALAEEDE